MSEPVSDLPPVTVPRFEVEPYRVEKVYSLYTVLACLIFLCADGVGMGYAASWVQDWAPKLEWLWLLLLAGSLAVAGWGLVASLRLRHDGYACLIAFLAALHGLGGFYFASYLRSPPEIEELARRWLPYQAYAQLQPRGGGKMERHDTLSAEMPADLKERLTEAIRKLPVQEQKNLAGFLGPDIQALVEGRQRNVRPKTVDKREIPPVPAIQLSKELQDTLQEGLADFSFWDYLNWRATKGVEVWIPRVKHPVNFGYIGSFIFWSIAAFLVFFIPAMAMCIRAEKPFCLICQRWKKERIVARLTLPEEEAANFFKDGNLLPLATAELLDPKTTGGTVRVKLASCEECQEASDVQVILEKIKKDKKDKEEFADLVKLTYPGLSLAVLESLLTPLPPPPAEPPPVTL
jgi:hypothetical protein